MISDDDLKRLRQQKPAWVEEPATVPQLQYIKILVEDRIVPENWQARITELLTAPGGLKKGKAGEIIANLKPLPIKHKDGEDRAKNSPRVTDIPPGRYAVQTGPHYNDLSYYRVKKIKSATGSDYRIMLQIAGPNEHLMRGAQAKDAAKLIVRAGIGDSAALYGHTIGRCFNCNTQITNRISRELGIGPVCGGRVYSDWDSRVTSARDKLRAEGFDPYENV